MLVNHIKINIEFLDDPKISNNDIENKSKQIMSSREIILEISNKSLHKEILKFISPHFQLRENENLLENF